MRFAPSLTLGLLSLLACEAGPALEARLGDATSPEADAGPSGSSNDAERPLDAQNRDGTRPDSTLTDASPVDAALADAAPAAATCVVDVPTVPIRRLSPKHYREAVRHLLHQPEAEPDLAPDPAPALSLLGAEKLAAAARALADALDFAAVLPCDPNDIGEEACLLAFIELFSAEAFRRPPTDAERAWLIQAHDGLPDAASFEDRVRLLVEIILQSPAFLYLIEVGEGDSPVRPLSDHELATRLAFGFLGAPPSGTLRAAADQGILSQPIEMAHQIDLLLADPRARNRLSDFLAHWFELERFDQVSKSAATWPQFTPELRAEMRAETEALFSGAETLEALLTSTEARVGPALAAVYGVLAGDIQLDPQERAGVLTRAAFLSLRAGPEVQSPIHRGAFIRRHLLCLPMPPPPANVTEVPIVRGSQGDDGHPRTLREIVTARTAAPDCMGCHALINPIGFALENFNGIGGFQTEESGYDRHLRQPYTVPVDARGTVPGSDIEGELVGGVALSQALAASPQVADCIADQWFVWFFERPIEPQDACSVEQLRTAFRASGGRFDVLLRTTPTLPAFRLIRGTP